jgi:leucyl/phenylalanyl-tRNA--protein transferase
LNGIFNPEIVLNAYRLGYFPMADSKDGDIYWHSPDPRAIFPIDVIKFDKNVIKKIRRGDFKFTIDNNFENVILECANRENTWINDEIIDTYIELHNMGYAHSIETWKDGNIVGGLYGVAIGGAFFGESMFNKVSDSSKAAFYFLINHLREKKYVLLDSQYINDFTQKLGAILIPKKKYMKLLEYAISLDREFYSFN